jgi:hypothetical protein
MKMQEIIRDEVRQLEMGDILSPRKVLLARCTALLEKKG